MGRGQSALDRRLHSAFVVAGAVKDARAGNVLHAHLQFVELAGSRNLRLKSEDVDDLLMPKHAIEIGRQIIRVAEDLAARGTGEKKEAGI